MRNSTRHEASMIQIDLSGKTVLITGGTRGIGLATALEFARAGAGLVLTYKWGSADLEDIYRQFEQLSAPKPLIVPADVSVDEDTDRLIEKVAGTCAGIDVFVSNVGFALRTVGLEDYKKRSLFKALEYSTWPLIAYLRKIKQRFGRYPRHVVAISSDGPDHFYRGYDFVAASKALLEFFSRYLSVHLIKEGSRVNVIRFGTVKTESFQAIFGEEFFHYMSDHGVPEEMIMKPEDCGKAVLALCSGYLDAINGQILHVDYGLPFQDNSMMRYLESKDKLL